MNKKGFTLVEILAIVVILSLLAVAAGVGVIGVLQKQRQKLAYTAEQNVHDASVTFCSKNANYMKACTDSDGANIVISQKNVEEANNYLREKFKDFSGENLYQLYKNYSINGNDDPANKYELDPYIKVSNRSCYKLITVGELIEQGLISDSDGMCNKSSMIIVYRKADAKNTAGMTESVQESGVCKSDRKTESGPVVTITPPSDLSLSNSKKIKVMVTTESTKLKTSFKMKYGWSKDKMIKPASYSDLEFKGNTEKSGSAEITVGTLNETRYLWIQGGVVLDNKNNKTSEMLSGPYAFLPTVNVVYDVNTGDTSSCPAKKIVVFGKTYGKNINDVEEELCTPTKTGYDFKGWYKDDVVKIENGSKVTQKIDHTLVAKWEPHIYTITLDKNLATNNPTPSVKVTYDTNKLDPTTITVPVRTYTVKGFGIDASRKSNNATVSSTADLVSNYIFNGWTITKNGTNILLNNEAAPVFTPDLSGYTESGIWRKSTDTTVYAKWTSASVTLPTIIKTGYDCGWTTSSTGTTITNLSGSNYTPTANTDMYGVCSACKYKIIFNKNNASATGTTADKECTYDSSCKLTKNSYSLSGYTFNGWNSQSDKTGTNYIDEATVKNLTNTCNGTVNMYANWCQNCATVSHGSCSLSVNIAGTCTYITSCNAGYKLTSGASTRNPTCTSIQFNIAYDANGGSNAPASHSCAYNAACNLSNTKPTLTNGTFSKWNTKADCTGTNYDSGASVKNASTTDGATVTYYACYKCNTGYHKSGKACVADTYTVKYSATGASNVPGDQTKYHNTNLTLSSKVPTKSGKTFNGWQDSDNALYNAGGTYTKNKSITMTALWCDNCNPTSPATCSLNASTAGTCTYTTSCPSGYKISNNGKKNPSCTVEYNAYPMICVTFRTDSYCSDSTQYNYRNAVEVMEPKKGLKSITFDCDTSNCKREFPNYGGVKTRRNEGWCSNSKNTSSKWTMIKACNMEGKCTSLKSNEKIVFGSVICSSNSTDDFLKNVKDGHGPIQATPTRGDQFTYSG